MTPRAMSPKELGESNYRRCRRVIKWGERDKGKPTYDTLRVLQNEEDTGGRSEEKR